MDERHIPGETGLADRRRALEEAFFTKRNHQLIEEARHRREIAENTEALSAATGITNGTLIERLMKQGVTTDTLVAISLVPLVVIAWADKSLEIEEREAILKAAAEAGIAEGSPSAQLLDRWLQHPPEEELVATWHDYVKTLIASLDDGEIAELRKEVLDRAQEVAFAAGGFLGIGAVSWLEKRELEVLSSAFDR